MTDQRERSGMFRLDADKSKIAVVATAVAAWSALALVLVVGVALLCAPEPRAINVRDEMNDYFSAQKFGKDYLVLVLTGGPEVRDQLASMTAMPVPELPEKPFTVLSLDPEPATYTDTASGREWTLMFRAVVAPPGNDSATLSVEYVLDAAQRGPEFLAVALPRPVTSQRRPFKTAPEYTKEIAAVSPLGSTAADFLNGFYADAQRAQLKDHVTGKFADPPMPGSPYTSVEVLSILGARDGKDPSAATPGTTAHVLVTAKALAAKDTWHLMSVPLRLVLATNKTWQVDGFDAPTHYGKTSAR